MGALSGLARRRLLLAILAIGSAAGLAITSAQAQPPPTTELSASEYRVKAAFLYKFTGYVEWPRAVFAGPEAPLVIGVMGSEDMADALTEFIGGRRANERPVLVRRLRAGDAVAGMHVLFLGRGQPLPAPQQKGLLAVTETEGALAQGSVINFVQVERHVRFEIALDVAARNELRLSSRMLAVAHRVVGAAGAPP